MNCKIISITSHSQYVGWNLPDRIFVSGRGNKATVWNVDFAGCATNLNVIKKLDFNNVFDARKWGKEHAYYLGRVFINRCWCGNKISFSGCMPYRCSIKSPYIKKVN